MRHRERDASRIVDRGVGHKIHEAKVDPRLKPKNNTVTTPDIPPFSTRVMLHVDDWWAPTRKVNSRVDRLVRIAESLRKDELKPRSKVSISQVALNAMNSVADERETPAGQVEKIYHATVDGVGMNARGIERPRLWGRRLKSFVKLDLQKLITGESAQKLLQPAATPPDRGIAVERTVYDPENPGDYYVKLDTYFKANAQFREAFGTNPVKLITRMLANPYQNYDLIRKILDHGVVILGASMYGQERFKDPSALEVELERSLQVAHERRLYNHELGRRYVGGLVNYSHEDKNTQEVVRGLGTVAQQVLQSTNVVKEEGADDLLEIVTVGLVHQANILLQTSGIDENWKKEVREVVGWALDNVGKERLQQQPSDSLREMNNLAQEFSGQLDQLNQQTHIQLLPQR